MTRYVNSDEILDIVRTGINTETLAANKTLVVTDYVLQHLDPNSTDRNVTLPAEASSTNLLFIILNIADGAGEDLVIQDDTPTTITTLGPGMAGIFSCNGTAWKYENESGVFYDKISGRVGIGTLSPAGLLDLYGGTIVGNQYSNQQSNGAAFDILGLCTDPKFFNLLCEDPSGGTMTDISGAGHNGTYYGTMTAGDRINKGSGWAIDYDGIDDYVSLGDHADFSFGDGLSDVPFTIFGAIEIVATTGNQMILSKADNTTGFELREWAIYITDTETLYVYLFDESTNVFCYRVTDAALSAGWHTFVITYDGTGGTTAANGITVYIDGAVVASTATNDASYVAMENLAASVLIGARKGTDGNPNLFFTGDMTGLGIDKGYVWSAMDVRRFHLKLKSLLNL